MVFRFVPRGDRYRTAVVAHVRRVYGQTYGAVIRRFPELMVGEFDDAGTVRCAAGLRRAADGFFSENYVDAPLEVVLSGLAGNRIGRDRIIEVTNLASCSASSSAHLIENIIAFARQVGTDWAVFTITPRLNRLLCRMKLPVVVLGPAERSRIANPADWGSYYENRPVVAAMQDSGSPRQQRSLSAIFPAAAPAGRSEPLVPANG